MSLLMPSIELVLGQFDTINKTDHPDCGTFGQDQFGWRELEDGRVIAMIPTLSGNWRIIVGKGQSIFNGYCYDRKTKTMMAVLSLATWDGEGDPLDGWHRNPYDARRRPDGDPTREYIAR